MWEMIRLTLLILVEWLHLWKDRNENPNIGQY